MCLVFGGNGVVYLAEVLDVQDVPPAPSLVDPLPLLRHVLILILDGRSLAVGQPGGGENVQLDEGEHQHWLGLAMMRLIRMIFILLKNGSHLGSRQTPVTTPEHESLYQWHKYEDIYD